MSLALRRQEGAQAPRTRCYQRWTRRRRAAAAGTERAERRVRAPAHGSASPQQGHGGPGAQLGNTCCHQMQKGSQEGKDCCISTADPSMEASLASPDLIAGTPTRATPAVSSRTQPEGSSRSTIIPLVEGSLSVGSSVLSPISPVGSLPSASDRNQPEGSRNIGQERQPSAGLINPLFIDIGRSQPEGSGGSSCLLSPVHFRLPSRSASIQSLGSPSLEPPLSPSRRRCGSPFSELGRTYQAATTKLLASGEDGSLPRTKSSQSLATALEELPQRYDTPDWADTSGHLLARPSESDVDEEFRITIVTWNVGSAVPPSDITSLLCLNAGDGKTDMFVIGLQEVNSMINKRLKDALFSDQWSEVFMDVLSPFSYVLVTSVRMQGVLLMVFAKYFHLPFLRHVQTDCTRTGLGGYWGNKGGVSVRLALFGHMVCFLNCHLPAHMENSEQRMENFESILQLQQFEGPLASGVLDHDIVFWFGDLNFRIEDFDMHFVKYAIDNNKLGLLWEKDQLTMAKGTEHVLRGFLEGPLKFPPTYKFDVGTNNYDTSAKKRKPAWTDRILWKMKSPTSPQLSQNTKGNEHSEAQVVEGIHVKLLSYRSHMQYTESDHKPVSAIFSLKFRYKVDTPLVQILEVDEWCKASDAIVVFKMASTYAKNSWDWIGLYKVGFRHHKDYVAYVWAKHEEEVDGVRHQHQVTFNEESLPKGTSEYILGYYSNNLGTLVGVTEPFQISLPGSESSSSSQSDSSVSSSEEEDSTMVLLRPKSRSPSPGQRKQRRSRSPVLAKFQDLILMPSPREKSKSRSPSPRRSKSPRQEVPYQRQSHSSTEKDPDEPSPSKTHGRKTTSYHNARHGRPESPEALRPIPVPPVRPAAVGKAEAKKVNSGQKDSAHQGRKGRETDAMQGLRGGVESEAQVWPVTGINREIQGGREQGPQVKQWEGSGTESGSQAAQCPGLVVGTDSGAAQSSGDALETVEVRQGREHPDDPLQEGGRERVVHAREGLGQQSKSS
ncbi:phosphatidylinositol 4,5-bisphosphate 5-phosphatase A [Ambystoma mexicanum]|uniref:phosphatidylinositol 4,5-bisphosphate 5-phosphatase A n=1 Tax=Ambystoma mexicanum TaxID=8296 RepID=UPI0037E873D5